MIGFTLLTKPSKEEIERQQRLRDSIALVQQQQYEAQLAQDSAAKTLAVSDSINVATDTVAAAAANVDIFGDFSASSVGEENFITLENDLLKVILSNKGGRVYSVELKKYKAQEGKPLLLFDKDESSFNYTLVTNNNRVLNSSDLYFTPQGEIVKDSNGNQTLTLRLNTTKPESYIDFIYMLPAEDYMMTYTVKANKMNEKRI